EDQLGEVGCLLITFDKFLDMYKLDIAIPSRFKNGFGYGGGSSSRRYKLDYLTTKEDKLSDGNYLKSVLDECTEAKSIMDETKKHFIDHLNKNYNFLKVNDMANNNTITISGKVFIVNFNGRGEINKVNTLNDVEYELK